MIVGITGAQGFLGWHIRARMHLEGIHTASADRTTFGDSALLDRFVETADVIIHAAAINRADTDDEITAGNPSIAQALIDALRRTQRAVPIIYTNSTQSELQNPYGAAKKVAAQMIAAHCAMSGVAFVDLVLPHLFGEYGRPNYNSAITTFAHHLATGATPTVNPAGRVELLHAQDVAARCVALVNAPEDGQRRMAGEEISVGDAWNLLEAQHDRYVNDRTVPFFGSRFELQIFNTLRAQLFLQGHYPRSLVTHSDARGAFSELCRADCMGQTSLSTSRPGVTRGDHFHLDKVERFVVVEGQATIRLRRVLTDEVISYSVDGAQPVFVDMPPLTTHNITNVGTGTLTTMFWAADHFDAARPDTYGDSVELDAKEASP